MKREPILIVERDPTSRAKLVHILASAGYDVYGAGANKLVTAVAQTEFPIVIIDITRPDLDVPKLIHSVHKRRANTAVILTGSDPDIERIIDGLRAGASDFLNKPYDDTEVQDRVFAALERRKLDLLRSQPRESSGMYSNPRIIASQTRSLLVALQDFHDQVVEVFLDIEQRNVQLQRKVDSVERNENGNNAERSLTLVVSHPDPAVTEILARTLENAHCDVLPQVFTGGGLLEQIGATPVDIVLVAADLPDIPGTIVASNLTGPGDYVSSFVMSGWGTSEVSLAPSSGDGPNKLATPDTFPNIVQEIVAEHRDREEAHRFAQQFKAKHQDFIRLTADIRSRLDRALEEAEQS